MQEYQSLQQQKNEGRAVQEERQMRTNVSLEYKTANSEYKGVHAEEDGGGVQSQEYATTTEEEKMYVGATKGEEKIKYKVHVKSNDEDNEDDDKRTIEDTLIGEEVERETTEEKKTSEKTTAKFTKKETKGEAQSKEVPEKKIGRKKDGINSRRSKTKSINRTRRPGSSTRRNLRSKIAA